MAKWGLEFKMFGCFDPLFTCHVIWHMRSEYGL